LIADLVVARRSKPAPFGAALALAGKVRWSAPPQGEAGRKSIAAIQDIVAASEDLERRGV